jgi:hypothetical protein
MLALAARMEEISGVLFDQKVVTSVHQERIKIWMELSASAISLPANSLV